MSRMIGNDSDNAPSEKSGAHALYIRGARFTNSAAKFWSSLIDEVHYDYPECDVIVLDTLTDVQLSRELLFPETALQYAVDRHIHSSRDIRQMLHEALVELALTGPPGAIHIRLCSGDVENKRCDLPLDCVDADIFPCLLVWLLEWAEIPECLWNIASVQGEFLASDKGRGVQYHLCIELSNDHVKEGLFRKTIAIRFD